MEKVLRLDLSVLLYPAPDVPGCWMGHCLNLDVMSQGLSPAHARDMLMEAVSLTLADDLAHGRSPEDRPSADPAEWEQFERVMKNGKLMSLTSIDPDVRPKFLATHVHMLVSTESSAPREPYVMPAWMITQNGNSLQPAC